MKERPINLTADEVRAVLNGRMTQLRRPMAHQPPKWCVRHDVVGPVAHFYAEPSPANALGTRGGATWTYKSPLGGAGDVLWVREAFMPRYFDDGRTAYRADWHGVLDGLIEEPSWRSSTQMPRWAARLTLEVTAVRVERLQSITEDDAWASGVEALDGRLDDTAIAKRSVVLGLCIDDSRVMFAEAWDARYGKTAPWASNPWCWVCQFKRAERALFNADVPEYRDLLATHGGA